VGRRRERRLLVAALGVGLAGPVLVAVVNGATFAPQPGLSIPRVAAVWLQMALAVTVCHAVLARRRSDADPLLLPLSVALCGLGLTIVFSLSPTQAQKQVNWLFAGLALVLAATSGLGDLTRLGRYAYLWGVATVVLLVIPMLFAREINGARLWLEIGGLRFQPGELAKVTLVLFCAAYLASARGELLTEEPRYVGGLALPDPRYLGPLALMWLLGMALLVVLRDLGTAALFFGTFVCLLYAASANSGYVAVGGLSFAGGAWLAQGLFPHVHRRLEAWLNPWSDKVIADAGYQVTQALFAIAAGGVTGVGLGLNHMQRVPAATTDLPFAALCEETGLWGATLVLLLYALWVQRALRIAVRQRERFTALLAAGLGCLMALQVLVIVGGVTKLIPLTGITLPFVSYGGSSLLTNCLMLGLLLRCSEGAQ